MEEPEEFSIVDLANMSESNDSDDGGSIRGNSIEDRNRRQAERRLIRENNPLTNLEAIQQRLGREAAERFRSMIEERKQQTVKKVTARVDKEWLKKYLDEEMVDLVEDRSATAVRNIAKSIGPLGAYLIIKFKNLTINPIEIQYK